MREHALIALLIGIRAERGKFCGVTRISFSFQSMIRKLVEPNLQLRTSDCKTILECDWFDDENFEEQCKFLLRSIFSSSSTFKLRKYSTTPENELGTIGLDSTWTTSLPLTNEFNLLNVFTDPPSAFSPAHSISKESIPSSINHHKSIDQISTKENVPPTLSVKSKFGGGAELDRTKLNYGLDIPSVLLLASCDASSSSPSNQISESLLARSQSSSSEHLPLLISSPNDWL
jgi:hypothetical protein